MISETVSQLQEKFLCEVDLKDSGVPHYFEPVLLPVPLFLPKPYSYPVAGSHSLGTLEDSCVIAESSVSVSNTATSGAPYGIQVTLFTVSV